MASQQPRYSQLCGSKRVSTERSLVPKDSVCETINKFFNDTDEKSQQLDHTMGVPCSDT